MRKSAPVLLLVILFGAMAWYFLTKKPEEVHELPIPHTPPAMPVVEKQVDPVPLPEDTSAYVEPEPVDIPPPLPLLNESDSQFSLSLSELVGADPMAGYLVKSQVISRLVAAIDSLTSRQVPVQINPVKPAGEKFVTDIEGENVLMSAQNFARYDGYVALLESTDVDALMAIYQHYYPLFQQAWEENGGEGTFNQRLAEVIDNLLETPDVPGPVFLTKPEAVYLFEDPALEAMTAGQKILVRMGTVNASVVKEKLGKVRTELDAH